MVERIQLDEPQPAGKHPDSNGNGQECPVFEQEYPHQSCLSKQNNKSLRMHKMHESHQVVSDPPAQGDKPIWMALASVCNMS